MHPSAMLSLSIHGLVTTENCFGDHGFLYKNVIYGAFYRTIRRHATRLKETGSMKNRKVNRRRHVLTEETLDEIGERK